MLQSTSTALSQPAFQECLLIESSFTLFSTTNREFSNFINNTFNEIRTGVQEAVSGVDHLLDSAVEGINHLPGVNIKPPNITPPNLDFLTNVALPSDFMNALVSLNSSLPTLDELREKMNGVIAIPFEAVRADINSTLKNATVDRNLLPVPAKETMTFCQVRAKHCHLSCRARIPF